MARRVTVMIDLEPSARYFRATLDALEHAIASGPRDLEVRVVNTAEISPRLIRSPGNGVVVGPGSPYQRPDLAEDVIRVAREQGVPLVGT